MKLFKWLVAALLRVPRAGAALYRKEGDENLYVYEERAGFNNIAQDWWRPVRLLSNDRIEYLGPWRKFNVGYPPNSPEDKAPYFRMTEPEVQLLVPQQKRMFSSRERKLLI